MSYSELNRLIDAIAPGVAVLTANKRLSSHITQAYAAAMAAAGTGAWVTPVVMPLASWIEQAWRADWPAAPLLSPLRSFALWKNIIAKDRLLKDKGVLDVEGAAKSSFDAYSLMKEYSIHLPVDEIYLSEEGAALKRWSLKYEKEIKRLGFVDSAMVAESVLKLIRAGSAGLPEKIILAGFDDLTPRAASIMEAAKKAGASVDFWPERPSHYNDGEVESGATINPRPYPDESSEVKAAARWVRKTMRPGLRIGIIVPELNRYHAVIKREFRAELDPTSALTPETHTDAFNISLGTPLYQVPLVRSALDLLSIGIGSGDLSALDVLLHCPYILTDAELAALAEMDAELRERNIHKVSLKEIRTRAEKTEATNDLFKRLGLWMDSLAGSGPARRSPGQWAEEFNALLRALGWPSESKALCSSEYQACEAWKALLDELSAMDDILGAVSRSEAVDELVCRATDAIHQPETAASSVQVLGMLEATGLEFDHIWIMGAHDDALPATASPNPFIPIELQKKAKLPRSSAEQALAYARTTLTRVLKSAPRVEVSFPLTVDNKEVKPSPLITVPDQNSLDQNKIDAEPPPPVGSRLKDGLLAKDATEETRLDAFVPVAPNELAEIRGGSSILKDQSACPFRAFAIHRLNARTVAELTTGIDAMTRGNIVHHALKVFWEAIGDSTRLKEVIENRELDGHIEVAVSDALKEYSGKGRFARALMELEKERVSAELRELAALDTTRGYFSAVAEQELKIDLQGLTITARADRIDEIEEGVRVVIDYKTGRCNKNDWLSERPRDPQLPLYNLSGDFDAVAFMSIGIKGVKYVGLAREEGVLPGVEPLSRDKWRLKMTGVEDWKDLKARWRATLENLADGFVRGDARVDPNENLKGRDFPCTYCEVMPLCRIFDRQDKDAIISRQADGD